jgi:phage replication-related protein YjqB (UPF0714/DUF867 family)
LLAHPEVEERSRPAGPLGFMAFHGGLEEGTAEIAEAAAAGDGASLYVVRQPAELRWHVPSHSVDPADSVLLRRWLSHVQVAIALHGYGRIRQPGRILLGGRNRALAARLADSLTLRLPHLTVVTDLNDIPRELRGLHPANPVNRPREAGVQVELPPRARDRRLDPEAPGLVVEALVVAARAYQDATTGPDGFADSRLRDLITPLDGAGGPVGRKPEPD